MCCGRRANRAGWELEKDLYREIVKAHLCHWSDGTRDAFHGNSDVDRLGRKVVNDTAHEQMQSFWLSIFLQQ